MGGVFSTGQGGTSPYSHSMTALALLSGLAASVMSGSTRYETADNMQVYLWYRGQYYPTTLAQVNPEEYHLIGWYDNLGCTAGNKIRVLVAVKKD